MLSMLTMPAHTAPQTGIGPTATANFQCSHILHLKPGSTYSDSSLLHCQTHSESNHETNGLSLNMGPNNDSATLQSLDEVVASPELLSPVRSSLVIDRILTLQSLQTASKSAAVTWSR